MEAFGNVSAEFSGTARDGHILVFPVAGLCIWWSFFRLGRPCVRGALFVYFCDLGLDHDVLICHGFIACRMLHTMSHNYCPVGASRRRRAMPIAQLVTHVGIMGWDHCKHPTRIGRTVGHWRRMTGRRGRELDHSAKAHDGHAREAEF